MRRLTDSPVGLARLDAGEEPMRLEDFDLATVGRDCVELVRPLAAARELTLQAQLPPRSATGDPRRIA
jgi:signal transduction histidine kinase